MSILTITSGAPDHPQPPAMPPPSIDATADWNIRKTGAILAVNFDVADVTAARAADWWGQDNGLGDPYIDIVATNGLSGKCLRVGTDPVQATFDEVGIWLEGGPSQGAGLNDFWLQFGLWGDGLWNVVINSNNLGPNRVGAPKICIIDEGTTTANFGELVIVNFRCLQEIAAYRKTATESSAYIERTRTLSGHTAVTQAQNAIDAGTPASPSTVAEFKQRYGHAFSGNNSISPEPTQGVPLDQQAHPDTDVLQSGVVMLPRGNWVFIETHIDVPNDRIRIWAAVYGEDPVLIMDTDLDDTRSGAGLDAGKRYDQFHFTPFQTGHLPQGDGDGNGETLDHTVHFQECPELIVSSNPIPFPGNKAVPGTSALAQAAAELPAGQWVQMTGTDLSAIPRDTETVLGNFANQMPVDTQTNSVLFAGTTDPAGNITVGFCRYREAQDDIEVLNWPSWLPQPSQSVPSHISDGEACDPDGRTMLKFKFGSSADSRTPRSVDLDNLNATWTSRATITAAGTDTVPALEFWPARNSYVACHTFNTGPNRHKLQELAADLSGSWADIAGAESSTYHNIDQSICAVHGTEYLVWGGGVATNILNRSASDGTTIQTSAMPAALSNIRCNGSSIMAGVAGKLCVYGGTSGSAGVFFEYDPTDDSWSPSLSHPLTGTGGKVAWQKQIAAFKNLGVIMIMDAQNDEVWLYRPTA